MDEGSHCFQILGRAKGRSEVECKTGPEDGINGNNKSIAETVCLQVSKDGEIWLAGMAESMMEVKETTTLRRRLTASETHAAEDNRSVHG